MAVGGKPPSHWRDSDVDAFETRLRALVIECDFLGEIANAAGDDVQGVVASIGVRKNGKTERRQVMAIPPGERTRVRELTKSLHHRVEASGLDVRAQVLALSMVAHELMAAGSTGELRKTA